VFGVGDARGRLGKQRFLNVWAGRAGASRRWRNYAHANSCSVDDGRNCVFVIIVRLATVVGRIKRAKGLRRRGEMQQQAPSVVRDFAMMQLLSSGG
jgi:hypothetical protein